MRCKVTNAWKSQGIVVVARMGGGGAENRRPGDAQEKVRAS